MMETEMMSTMTNRSPCSTGLPNLSMLISLQVSPMTLQESTDSAGEGGKRTLRGRQLHSQNQGPSSDSDSLLA